MAFPIPTHLPRKKDPQDVSTKILTKVSEATAKSLNAQLATSWVTELDDTITQTRQRIHERISDDLPAFESQLSSARSIQERLQALSTNVESLDQGISNPELGLIPTLVNTLTNYASSSRETLDADIDYGALAHLLGCRDEYWSVRDLVHSGQLPGAVVACKGLSTTIFNAPEALRRSTIFQDLNRNFTATQARAEEQLNDAYSRSIRVSSSELAIWPSVQVRQSETVLSLSSVLGALSSESLAAHLASLRRDLTTFYIDHLMKQPTSVSVTSSKDISGIHEHNLSLTPAPPSSTPLPARLENLASVLGFLDEHLFPSLPNFERSTFAASLCKPTRNAVLSHLLIPALPSSMKDLPAFLELTRQAVKFEHDYVISILGDHSGDNDIAAWVKNAGLHYERKRRTSLLEDARSVILLPEDEGKVFRAEMIIPREPEHSTPAQPPESDAASNTHPTQNSTDESDSTWDFEDEEPAPDTKVEIDKPAEPSAISDEENGWEFDDDLDAEAEPELAPEPEPKLQRSSVPISEDSGDAWDWNDDKAVVNNSADDPWDDGWKDEPTQVPLTNGSAPKPAKGLELRSKKGRQNGHPSPIAEKLPSGQLPPAASTGKENGVPGPSVVHETYAVSGRTKELMDLVESILAEGDELISSGVLSSSSSFGTQPGNLIVQAASLSLELYRALYPVAFSAGLAPSPRRSARFHNDCIYLYGELQRLSQRAQGVTDLVKDSLHRDESAMKLLGDSWFHDIIDKQNAQTNELLDRAGGFVETTDQDRFDECESAVHEVLQRVRRFAQQLKDTLPASKYYVAIGAAADTALSRMLSDILALPDITEAESHRLNELCHILNALEGLFVEDPSQPSFVVSYVPQWLKFSYLSELLEASIADISYLFEEGALVDFEIDELVSLVRALFADTPLRTSTINRFLQGHPVHS